MLSQARVARSTDATVPDSSNAGTDTSSARWPSGPANSMSFAVGGVWSPADAVADGGLQSGIRTPGHVNLENFAGRTCAL